MRLRSLLVASLAAGLLVAGCGGSDEVSSSGPGRSTTTAARADRSSSSSSSSSSTAASGSTGVPAEARPTPGPTSPSSTPPGSGSVATGDPGPDTPVSSPPGTDGTVPEPTPTEVPNRHDLLDPRPHAPEGVTVDPADPRLVHVRFWGGIPECYGAEVTVRETSTEVVVSLRSGRVPSGPEVCIDLAQYQQITVRLAAPLGDRTLRSDPA